MKLIIMTRPTFFVEEDKILTALFDGGLDSLHLNKTGASPVYSERLLSLLPDTYYDKITVHDHYYLKNEYGLAGIHLDSQNKEPPKDYKGRFSVTCTDIGELNVAKRKAEYVFLETQFGTSGNNAQIRKTLETACAQDIIDKRVYASGSIGADNIKEAEELGFGGVVICGDLWDKFNIHNELDYKDLISHFDKLRKALS